ncbi:MAG: hypothetical protein K8R54_12120 [Bacteroidales bacterium]|nr:hypothetical protein [Bacteroidales bacterium]
MQIIKKTIFIVIILCFTLGNSYSVPIENIEEKTYYWFSIELYEYEWEEGLKILNINAKIKEGTVKEFKKLIKKNLKKSILFIGPFMSKADAEFAVNIFREMYSKEKMNNANDKYLFFSITLEETDNSGIFKRVDVGENINIGSLATFKNVFLKKLKQKGVLIGPFNTKTDIKNGFFLNLY